MSTARRVAPHNVSLVLVRIILIDEFPDRVDVLVRIDTRFYPC